MRQTFLSTREVAKRLKVSVRTVHRLVGRGALKPVVKQPGDSGAYVFDEESVRAYEKESVA